MLFQDFQNALDQHARAAGFDLWGVVPAAALAELNYFPAWIGAGNAGDMKYLESRNDVGELKRASLRNTAPWANSVVVCALNYNSEQPYSTDATDAAAGWISRYAWFRQVDYHDAMLHRLRDLETRIREASPTPIRTWCYVDTGPVIERVWAKYAGIGWIGKNTCVINEQLGSWLFLGVMLTDVELRTDLPMPPVDRCGSCTRCIEACPTRAITAPYKLDPRVCISYLTIEKRGAIPDSIRPLMGRQVFGCDICQDVCPWNGGVARERRPPATCVPEFQPVPELVNPDLAWLAGLSRDQFNEVFRHTPIKRSKFAGLRRNVAIAMGNSDEKRFLPALESLAQDEDPSVAEHARWAIHRLTTV
jgi:epoxyqueuosine reductase